MSRSHVDTRAIDRPPRGCLVGHVVPAVKLARYPSYSIRDQPSSRCRGSPSITTTPLPAQRPPGVVLKNTLATCDNERSALSTKVRGPVVGPEKLLAREMEASVSLYQWGW